MISVEEALKIVAHEASALGAEKIRPFYGLRRFLMEDSVSPIAMPPFRQSAMDGYAIHSILTTGKYDVIGEVTAGDNWPGELKKNQALRIYTGAKVPDSAISVVQQEWAVVLGQTVTFNGDVREGQNIRPKGEQIEKGKVALRKGTCLNAAAIGYLTGLGIEEITVGRLPNISLLSTGNELSETGEELEEGKIYESNLDMLEKALDELGYDVENTLQSNDNLNETEKAIDKLLGESDVVLITGGISAGKYDFVGAALEQLSVRPHFYKVEQRPGKPLWFGTKGQQLVFGLPGNPAAALTCFYIYVLPALRKMSGGNFAGLARSTGKLISPYQSSEKRAEFLKVQICNGDVHVLGGQNSSMLNTFALANGLGYVPGEVKDLKKGDDICIYNLPF